MPRIIVQAFAGRTLDQKRVLISGITEAVVSSFKADPDDVIVVIQEMVPENYGRAGILRADVVGSSPASGTDVPA